MGPNKKIVLGLVLVQIISASCGVSSPRKAEEPENEVEKGLKMLYNTYQKCGETEDMFSCLKVKALRFADRALKINNIPIFEGMTVIRNEESTSRSMPVPEFNENELPKDPEERQEALDDMLVDRVTRFLRTHSIQFDLPKIIDDSDKGVEEGRQKMKKMMGPLLMAAMMKGSMMAYALKAVGLLAAKALLVSKIALLLASIIGLKKLFSHGHSESKTIEIVQKPHISHAHTYSSGHDFGGFGGGGGGGGGGSGGWESSGHGGGYGRSLDGSVPQVYEKSRSGEEIPVGKGVDNVVRRSFDLPFPQAQELAYRGRIQQQQQPEQKQS